MPTPILPPAAPARARGLRLHKGCGRVQRHQPVAHADLHRGPAHQEAAAAVPGEQASVPGPQRAALGIPGPDRTPSLPPQFITDGYAAHLAQLKYNHRARPARNAATRMALRKGSFGLPSQGDFLRSRNHLLRTISAQPSGPGPRLERTQGQAEGEQRGQRSMSMAASCWGRAIAGRLEPGTAAGPK